LLTQYKAFDLNNYLADSWSIFRGEHGEFIRVLSPSQGAKETWYSGNVNAVYQNLEFIRKLNPEYILILTGGNVYKMN